MVIFRLACIAIIDWLPATFTVEKQSSSNKLLIEQPLRNFISCGMRVFGDGSSLYLGHAGRGRYG